MAYGLRLIPGLHCMAAFDPRTISCEAYPFARRWQKRIISARLVQLALSHDLAYRFEDCAIILLDDEA